MSKGLEALELLKTTYGNATYIYIDKYQDLPQPTTLTLRETIIPIIEKALKDYEKLKALYNNQISTITALIEENKDNEKKLKALEIIRNKRVEVNCFLIYDLERYNSYIAKNDFMKLTQEEYDLLKEVLL